MNGRSGTLGDEMEIVTRAQGVKTTLLISEGLFLKTCKDIEEVALPITKEACANLRDTLLPRIVIENFPL